MTFLVSEVDGVQTACLSNWTPIEADSTPVHHHDPAREPGARDVHGEALPRPVLEMSLPHCWRVKTGSPIIIDPIRMWPGEADEFLLTLALPLVLDWRVMSAHEKTVFCAASMASGQLTYRFLN